MREGGEPQTARAGPHIACRGISGAGDAEVGEHQATIWMEQQVRGLDIAMYQPARVRVVEGGGHLLDVGERVGERQPPGAQEEVGERPVRQVRHHQKRDVAILAEFVDRHDVGVVEPRGDVGLAAKPLQEDLPRLRTGGAAGLQHFYGHLASRTNLLGEVDRAHAADAKRPFEYARAKLRSQQLVGIPIAAHACLDLRTLRSITRHRVVEGTERFASVARRSAVRRRWEISHPRSGAVEDAMHRSVQ